MVIHQLPVSQFNAWLAAQAGAAVVLDVRDPWEWQTASIHAAGPGVNGFELVTIPLGELAGRLSELPPHAAVACLCHHGVRSQQAAAYLQTQGTDVVNLQGGIDAWSCEIDASVPRY